VRLDLISIFPDYFAPLRLSLLGRAIDNGLLDVHLHDLRDWTDNVHRSVDDTPYGGGPGMLMSAEPWGRALDSLLDVEPSETMLIVPSPSGRLFTQADAQDWAARSRLVIACGRYEGIDARVVTDAARRVDVAEVSIGDYVLAGGEVAALVIIEAVARLLPGFMGNTQSAEDDSFATPGRLEAPAYTRPPTWRDLDVPDVLLSGNHAAIAAWRADQAARRTATNRPDLLDPDLGPVAQ
jgi:tRNA (guanine37-N1)-methyltransferase